MEQVKKETFFPLFLTLFSALFTGFLFGVGLMVSGMTDPAKVIGFLDVTGNWNPSLAFVMGGALLVFMPSYFFLIKPRTKALNGDTYKLASNSKLDRPLIMGAVFFGLGWGLVGICPGPAITLLGSASINALLFILAMLVGSALGKKLT